MSRRARLRRSCACAVLSIAAIAGLAACGGSSGGTQTTAETSPDPIAPSLRVAVAEAAASGVPLRIPREMLARPPLGADQPELLRSPSDSYTLGLSRNPGCHLRSTCTVAIFSGFAGGGELSGRHLALAHGVTGIYEPGRCGKGCRFGTVEWRQGGSRYGIGVAGASAAALVSLANRAILAPPVPAPAED